MSDRSELNFLLGLWPGHDFRANDARKELAHLRACETWILNHAQHGVACSYWTDYKPNDPKFKYTPKPCDCGLAKLMEEMK